MGNRKVRQWRVACFRGLGCPSQTSRSEGAAKAWHTGLTCGFVGSDLRFRRSDNAYAPPFDAQPSFREQPDRFGIGLAFLFKHASGERVRRVVVEYRYGALKDDRPVIVDVIREVDGAAACLDAVSQRRFMNVMAVIALATEGRNKRRVDVHHAAREVIRNSK